MSREFTIKGTVPGLKRGWRHFSPLLRRQRALMTGSMLALFAGVLLRLLEPWPLKYVFDHLFRTKHHRFSIPWLDSLEPMTLLVVAAIAMVVFTGLRALADYWNQVGFALIGNRVLSELRRELYRHLQCLSLSFHSKARGGDLVVRVI